MTCDDSARQLLQGAAGPRAYGPLRASACAALWFFALSATEAFAARLGGAYYVDDAEIGKVGSCETESWGSFAANSDRILVFSPACVFNLGRPVELGTNLVNMRSDGDPSSTISLTAKTVPLPIGQSGFGLAIAGAVTYDPIEHTAGSNRAVRGRWLLPSAPAIQQEPDLRFTGVRERIHCARRVTSGSSPMREKFAMRGFVVGAMLALSLVSGALAEDQRNVNIVNATGYGIKFLGFNNPGDDDWSDNELGSVLRNGGSVYVKFNTADDGCVWNFKIQWADPGIPASCGATWIYAKSARSRSATTGPTTRHRIRLNDEGRARFQRLK